MEQRPALAVAKGIGICLQPGAQVRPIVHSMAHVPQQRSYTVLQFAADPGVCSLYFHVNQRLMGALSTRAKCRQHAAGAAVDADNGVQNTVNCQPLCRNFCSHGVNQKGHIIIGNAQPHPAACPRGWNGFNQNTGLARLTHSKDTAQKLSGIGAFRRTKTI